MKTKLTAYFDHDGKLPLQDRITLAKHHGIESIGLRSYQGRPLIEMSDRDAKDVYQLFKQENMSISFLDGEIGDYDLNSDSQFKNQLEQFTFLLDLSDRLRTNVVCLRLPQFTKVID